MPENEGHQPSAAPNHDQAVIQSIVALDGVPTVFGELPCKRGQESDGIEWDGRRLEREGWLLARVSG